MLNFFKSVIALFVLFVMLSGTARASDIPVGTGAPLIGIDLADVIPDHYIVVLNTQSSSASARGTSNLSILDILQDVIDLAVSAGGIIHFEYTHALVGFAAILPPVAVELLRLNPNVAYIQADRTVSINATQANPPSWGLDRIDQRNLPLDESYTYNTTGTDVTAYIIDTGIRITHSDFSGRAVIGTDTVGDGQNGNDCNGHGTHVAGTVGGTTYGVAKNVTLVAVRVLNCAGSGSFSGVAAGIDWVTADHQPGELAVANMSLGAQGSDVATETAVRNSIADGVTYAIASGNSNADACNFTPARVAEAITVNASDINDNRASFSNFGSCTDIFAPGVNITSAWIGSDTATNTISGTSMASPHVAGVAALYLEDHPSATPQQVQDALVAAATPNVVNNPGAGSPNRLLYSLVTDPDEDGDGYTVGEGDCDDDNADINPGAAELCNGVDDNCDGDTDEDNPGGGVSCNTGQLGVCSAGTTSCSNGVVVCEQNTQPSTEVCDNQDNDCDGVTDDNPTGVGDSCNTGQPGVCSIGAKVCTNGVLSCSQTVQPSNEVCDNQDNDCDGETDDGLTVDTDNDGFSTPASCHGTKNDCNDSNPNINPGAAEICDSIDNNCNAQVDEGLATCCLGRTATVVGTNGNDILLGTLGPDVIVGLGGNDLALNLTGNDIVCGGVGNDTLAGVLGTFKFDGGAGTDSCIGGLGIDSAVNCESTLLIP